MSSSESEDDNIVRYGTPLEPYEEDEVPSKRKFQQPSDQFAVDAHGRRRFHGAFTGGFSAGYGNTVGTAEGWTPANFKSSRSEKAQISSQKPEDFMDEEDRSEFGIAPRQIQTHNEYSGQKRSRQQRFHDGPIPGEPVLEQLVRAVHETTAVRMLRAMGWREGQGVGDRVTRQEKRRSKRQHKVYGCYVPPELRQSSENQSDDDSSDSEFEYDTLFAPDDYEPYVLQPKSDLFGLGYSGLSRHSVLGSMTGEYGSEACTSRSHLTMKDKGKKVSIRGQAFGVGALEADDEDIYATEDMSHYDFAIGGPAAEKDKKKISKEKGANVLEGFVKSSKPLPSVPSYPPPALPRDYIPAPAGAKRSRFEPTAQPKRDQGLGRHELTAEARGKLLGDEPMPKTSAQTNEQTKPKEDPIAKLLGRNVDFVNTTTPKEDKNVTGELDFISIKDSGKELNKVFKPFASDPKKQARYEKYVRDKDSFMAEWDSTMDMLSEWERNRELVEFEQAAKLYKPLASDDRFTHAVEPDEGALNPLCAVARSSINYSLATADQIDAAKRGMYGVLTRTEAAWRPEALVCKRFNVPDPMVARPDAKKEDKPKVSYSIFSYLESSIHDKESFAKEQTKFSGSKSLNANILSKSNQTRDENQLSVKETLSTGITSTSQDTGFNKRLTVAELFLKESEKDLKSTDEGTEVTNTINKFDKMDLYKSIFLSDSENEEDSSKTDDTSKNTDYKDFIDTPKNTERNHSPPRGIFANIDFDELNSWKRNADNKKPDTKNSNATNSKVKEVDNNTKETDEKKGEDNEANIYGPKIPESLKKRLDEPPSNEQVPERDGSFKPTFRSKTERDSKIQEIESSSSSDSWVEAKEAKSKKQKKKKSKKHKSKHKKSKHKKKK